MPDEVRNNLIDFVVDGKVLGKVTEKVGRLLCRAPTNRDGPGRPPVFCTREEVGEAEETSSATTTTTTTTAERRRPPRRRKVLTLTKEAGTTIESRTDAVMSVMTWLRSDGIISGWRDELYPVGRTFYDEPTLLVERAAAPFLGALEYGVHVNGLVRGSNGDGDGVKMWMARRSADKSKHPGMLDHIVAGGQPAGLSLMENVVKECLEEAGVPEHIARGCARPAGAISYETFTPVKKKKMVLTKAATGDNDDDDMVDGVINRVVLFNYDLMLPSDFVPTPVDSEVDEFFLWSVDEIKKSMALDYHDPIKPNCYLVIIDYLLRAGHLSPESRGYLDVLRELRSGSCC